MVKLMSTECVVGWSFKHGITAGNWNVSKMMN